MKKLVFIAALFLHFLSGVAQNETRSSRGYANHLSIPGSYIQTYDDKFLSAGTWTTGFNNMYNRAVIELGLDEELHLPHPNAFRVCATFSVELTNAAQVSTIVACQLDLNYDPSELSRYKDKSQVVFPDYYKARIYNVTLSTCASSTSCGFCSTPCEFPDIYLDASISTVRTYTFDLNTAFGPGDLTHTVNTSSDQLSISWPYIKGATLYELEYTFIDNYSTTFTSSIASGSLTYDLDHDATRIVTPRNQYDIPLTYERGYIVYRLRPVGTSTLNQRMEGAWYPADGSGTVSASSCSVAITPSFPAARLNWQSSKTFAESGKTGTGVSFSDAMGLSRQSLARLNTESKTIAQSTLFDFYGRPAVQVLPAPIGGLDFNYRFSLDIYTTGTTSTVFDKVIFDRNNTSSYCSPSSFFLDPAISLGATNYYSPDNSNKEGYQGYLPDAEGFPYTQVQYSNDGLSRPTKQTLPGKMHRLSPAGKEIKHVYTTPEQVQLDRLFGSEAGKASYYQRTSTTDPNGQISIEIKDGNGRTVASFLKGNNPSNLEPLDNQVATVVSLLEDYSLEPVNVRDEFSLCKEVNKTIEIYQTNSHEGYTYVASWGNAFTGDCDSSMCFHCVYDVTLSITNECGQQIFDYDGDGVGSSPAMYRNTLGPSPPYSGTLSCNQPTAMSVTGVGLTSSVSIAFPSPGKYKIYKKICVSNAPVADYSTTYLHTACKPDKCEIFNSALNKIDFTGCLPQTCQDCINSVNSYTATMVAASTATFSYPGPEEGGLNPPGDLAPGTSVQPVYTSSMTPQQLSEAYENCSVYCADDSRCSTYNKLMAADFFPGTGQFAATSTTSPTWSLSIFNPTNVLPGSPTWSTVLTYYNAAGLPDYVQLGGVNLTPYNLSQSDFITYFRKSWANSFLQYHPELCKKYFYCEIVGESMDYDENMSEIHHSDFACSSGGYWFPVRYGTYSNYKPTGSCTSSTAGIDPIGSSSYTNVTAFANAVNAFTAAVAQNFRNTGVDIYHYTAAQINTAITGPAPPSFTLAQDACSADVEWAAFKTYYLTAKKILYQNLLSDFLNSPSAYGASQLTCTPLPAGVKSHFPDPEELLNANFPSSGTLTPGSLYTVVISPPSGTTGLSSYTNSVSQFTSMIVPSGTVATSQCSLSCNSYTAGWDASLKIACPAYSSAPSTTQTAILDAMVAICMLGCDYSTYLQGASTTPPGTVHTLPSTQTVSTFQQVLDLYLPANGCSTIVLNGPPAYPVYNGTRGANDLSSCRCDIILETAHEYSTSGSPPAYEWQLFEQKYGFDLADYNSLKCACQTAISGSWSPGYAWSPTELNALRNYTASVNPLLECRSCLSCTQVVTVIDSLTLPVSSGYSLLIDRINLVPGNQLFVKNTLNSLFGLHTLQEYLSLYEDCASFSSTLSPYTFSNTLTHTAGDLFIYLQSLFERQSFLNTRVMTLCTDDKFYLSALYSGTLPVIPGYTFLPSQNTNTLSIAINLNATPIASIQLIKPSGYGGSWNDLISLSGFAAYCPPPLTSGANYGFQVNARDNTNAVVSLTGTATWAVSHLSSGSYTVPSLCPPEPLPEKNSCAVNLLNSALMQAEQQYKEKLASITSTFQSAWKEHCFASLQETFQRVLNGADEYSHTLYYYDLAGNLQRTVPPNGADPGILSTLSVSIPSSVTLLPAYSSSNAVNMSFVNEYHYDSYNNLTDENSVDGGKTQYYYDPVGRLMASQNAQQRAVSNSTNVICSYSLYDDLGRLTETGQVHLPSSSVLTITNAVTYATSINTISAREEVTRIFYDRATTTPSILAAFSGSVQSNLRNRVAYVTYADVYNSTVTNYDHASYYSYDDHGNVTELVQHNKQLDLFNQGFRNVQYEFELISGNMLKASYQKNKPDQFIHTYYYDDDNRLKEVFTSKDEINRDRDAKYFYYEHGPLARVERADKKVQGSDYLYTIHGWIKGINSDALSRTSDEGKDGTTGNAYLSSFNNVHNWFAGDAMGYSLNYYHTGAVADYQAIKTYTSGDANPLMAISGFSTSNSFYLDNNSNGAGDGPDLFNGNISAMVTSFIDKDPSNLVADNSPFPQLTAYRYDQLQRLRKMKSFHSYSAATPSWNPGNSSNYKDDYRMELNYDNNGNIVSLSRNGPSTVIVSGAKLAMDYLDYGYYNSSVYNQTVFTTVPLEYNSNKLRCVSDTVPSGNYSEDIDNSGCDPYEKNVDAMGFGVLGNKRYEYDAIGNLIADHGEHIALIEWTVDRKVKRITRSPSGLTSAGLTLPDIEYGYNSQRQRVMKVVKPRDPSTKNLKPEDDWIYTYYVYDASGNVMATYERRAEPVVDDYYKDQLSLLEQPIYGSERLALKRPENTFATWSYTFDVGDRNTPSYGPTADQSLAASGYTLGRSLGYKDFELTNHLGNVISTVSDRKIPGSYASSGCLRTYDFLTGVPSVTDIIPANMSLSASSGSLECTPSLANPMLLGSAILVSLGNNLSNSITYQVEFDFDPGSLSPTDFFHVMPYMVNKTTGQVSTSPPYLISPQTLLPAGPYSFTYSPSQSSANYDNYLFFGTLGGYYTFKLGNIKICHLLGPVASYSADIVSNTDYYPFGMGMPGRSWTGGDRYRYDYNGKESDKEVSSGFQNYGSRTYDTRIGKWQSTDPQYKIYPSFSPYLGFGNNPIYYIDPGGETLRVAGDAIDRENARVALQMLTNDIVSIDNNGLVRLVKNPSGGNLINGTKILRKIVDHEKTTTMNLINSCDGTKGNRTTSVGPYQDLVNNKRMDANVEWDAFQEDKGGRDECNNFARPTYISLFHELTHSLYYMNGWGNMWAGGNIGYFDYDLYIELSYQSSLKFAIEYNTRIMENIIREEHNLTLRKMPDIYRPNEGGGPINKNADGSLILRPAPGTSIPEGSTTPAGHETRGCGTDGCLSPSGCTPPTSSGPSQE